MLKATLRILALAFGLGLALSACSSVNPPTEQFPPLSFSSLPPYELNVGRIEVVSDFKSDGKYMETRSTAVLHQYGHHISGTGQP